MIHRGFRYHIYPNKDQDTPFAIQFVQGYFVYRH